MRETKRVKRRKEVIDILNKQTEPYYWAEEFLSLVEEH